MVQDYVQLNIIENTKLKLETCGWRTQKAGRKKIKPNDTSLQTKIAKRILHNLNTLPVTVLFRNKLEERRDKNTWVMSTERLTIQKKCYWVLLDAINERLWTNKQICIIIWWYFNTQDTSMGLWKASSDAQMHKIYTRQYNFIFEGSSSRLKKERWFLNSILNIVNLLIYIFCNMSSSPSTPQSGKTPEIEALSYAWGCLITNCNIRFSVAVKQILWQIFWNSAKSP